MEEKNESVNFYYKIFEHIPTILSVLAVVLTFSLPSIRKWIGIDGDVDFINKKIILLEAKVDKIETQRVKDVCRLSYVDKSLIGIVSDNTKSNFYLFKTLKADDFTLTNLQIKLNESISDISTVNSKNTSNTNCDFN